MKHLSNRLLLLSALFLSVPCSVLGDAVVKPKAFHRQTSSGDHQIETFINAGLHPGSKLSASIYKKSGGVIAKSAENGDVPDCTGSISGNQFCKDTSVAGRLRLLYQFSNAPASNEKLFINFAMTDDQNRDLGFFVEAISDLGVRLFVEKFKHDVTIFTPAGPKKMMVEPNAAIAIEVAAAIDSPAGQSAYRKQRIGQIFDWLSLQTGNSAGIANVRVESRTKQNPTSYTVTSFARFADSRVQAINDEGITVYLIGTEDLPTEKFDLEVVFNNNPPFELGGPLVGTASGVSQISTPDAEQVGKDKTLGARSLDTNLDLGLAFTSSVKDEKKDNATVRERSNNGTLDLRFAPWLNLRLSDPDRTQHFITPIFLDAKVSTGKITEDSLSLNRIVLGTEYVIRYLRSSEEGKRDKYVYSFRANNASDRDFKRAEGKFTFEFRPIWDGINNPLGPRFKKPVPMSQLIPDNGPKFVPVGWFGFQIQPFIGFEVGRAYRVRRDIFEGEELSRNVRRLILGTDLIFDLTRHVKLTLSDTSYIRGEAPTDRGRNYFLGEIEAPIGNLNARTAHSIFFSFERGDQPPFATPSVNALKLGYRIVADPFGKRR